MRSLSLNERRLVELVAANSHIARIDLSRQAGMTGATVTRLIGSLLELGVFNEKAAHSGASGQPKRMLSISSNSFYSAGLTFSLSEMEVAIVDFSGTILASKTLAIPKRSAAFIAKTAQKYIASMRQDLGIPEDQFIGVGCSIPGNFGPTEKSLKAHKLFLEFEDKDNLDNFANAFDAPFFMENDGSAAALGEHVFGREESDGASLFLVHIGYGLGGGAVVNGSLFRGSSGNACLPGVLFPYDVPRPTAEDLLDHLNGKGVAITDINRLSKLDDIPHAILVEWIDRAADQLRHAIRVISGLIDPSCIIIGGRLPIEINEMLIQNINSKPIEGPSRGLEIPPIRGTRLGPQAGAVGAACIPLFSTFFTGSYSDAGSNYLNGRRASS